MPPAPIRSHRRNGPTRSGITSCAVMNPVNAGSDCREYWLPVSANSSSVFAGPGSRPHIQQRLSRDVGVWRATHPATRHSATAVLKIRRVRLSLTQPPKAAARISCEDQSRCTVRSVTRAFRRCNVVIPQTRAIHRFCKLLVSRPRGQSWLMASACGVECRRASHRRPLRIVRHAFGPALRADHHVAASRARKG